MNAAAQSTKRIALPAEGQCRCGQLRFRITAPPMLTAVCHCTGCQRMSGSAFSTTVMVSGAGFEIVEGVSVIGGLRGPDIRHHHCPDCMSWVFTRFDNMDLVNVRATMLDDPSWFVPFIETYTSEKLPWAVSPAAHSYEKFPQMESLAGLIAAYAANPGPEE